VTCHPEWLKYFEIDQFQIPTVVYFYPEKELQANLIGKFDYETIEDHSDRYLNGKLPTFTPKVSLSNMKSESKDCSLSLDDTTSESDKELQDEILREILEEQAIRQQEEDAERAKDSKPKAAGKKGKKGKKKKATGAKKDEL
jgi:hypothetical protein